MDDLEERTWWRRRAARIFQETALRRLVKADVAAADLIGQLPRTLLVGKIEVGDPGGVELRLPCGEGLLHSSRRHPLAQTGDDGLAGDELLQLPVGDAVALHPAVGFRSRVEPPCAPELVHRPLQLRI